MSIETSSKGCGGGGSGRHASATTMTADLRRTRGQHGIRADELTLNIEFGRADLPLPFHIHIAAPLSGLFIVNRVPGPVIGCRADSDRPRRKRLNAVGPPKRFRVPHAQLPLAERTIGIRKAKHRLVTINRANRSSGPQKELDKSVFVLEWHLGGGVVMILIV